MRRTLIATVEPPLEAQPQWSIGALALSMARAAKARGEAVAIATPAHPHVEKEAVFDGRQVVVDSGNTPGRSKITIREGRLPSGIQLYAVSSGNMFAAPDVYELGCSGRPAPCERFALFCRSLVEISQRLAPPPNEVVLCEWPCAPAAALLRRGGFPIESAVLVAEPRFQGLVEWEAVRNLEWGVPPDHLAPESGEFFGRFSMLKYGLIHASRLLGLTPRHAQALCHNAAALEGVFAARRETLTGLDPAVFLAAARVSHPGNPTPSRFENHSHTRIQLHDDGAPVALLDAVFRLLPHMEEMGLFLAASEAALGRCPAGRYGALRHPDVLIAHPESKATIDASCGVHLFLDTEAAAPFASVRAWLAGHGVCAPASPALIDAREFPDASGAARARLFPFRAHTDAALLEILLAASRTCAADSFAR